MHSVVKSLFFIIVLLSTNVYAAEEYHPNSGDSELDSSLIALNKKVKNKTARFSRKLSEIFQVPESNVSVLFTHYEFTPADVLMTLSIADSSGEPVNNVSKTYFENRNNGWKYTLYQMKIEKGTVVYKQIKSDAASEY